MRGNPIREWIAFSLLWLALLVPVVRLTGSRGQSAAAVRKNDDAAADECVVQALAVIRYTGRPLFFRISQSGETLLEVANPPQGSVEQRISLRLEGNRSELLLQARWPDRDRHVLEVELIPDDETERTAHFWVEEELDAIASFRWPQREGRQTE